MRRDVRVDDCCFMRMRRVNGFGSGLMHMRVRRRDKPEEKREDRTNSPQPTRHDGRYPSRFVPRMSSAAPVPAIIRGMKTMTSVAVVVDHDKPGDEAIEVRFLAAQ